MFFDFLRDRKTIESTNLNKVYAKNFKAIGDSIQGSCAAPKITVRDRNLFVLDFRGDVMARQSKALAEEITSIIVSATPAKTEVLVRVHSPGGAAYAYGYAASQLERLKAAGINLTVAVDEVAASGGYMMAVVADNIIAAPLSVIGSVGVVAEFPNFFNFMKNMGIDYKQYTAGKFKRTVSPLGEITDEGEEKFKEDLSELFDLFRNHVKEHRPNVDIDSVATGEHWQAINAKDMGLVDKIQTSEDYIVSKLKTHNVINLKYIGNRKGLFDAFSESMSIGFEKALTQLFEMITFGKISY